MIKLNVSLVVLLLLLAPFVHGEESFFSRGHVPMIQGSTSETEVHFNVLVPRLNNYRFLAIPADAPMGTPPIAAEIIGEPFKDAQGLLHEKALKVKFTGLAANTKYNLEIAEITNGGLRVQDKRRFSTLDNTARPLKYVVASCFSDETVYEEARLQIWNNIAKQNADFLLLIGDQTYVDTFGEVERNKATELDVVMRYFKSFSTNPVTRMAEIPHVIATWDDHDTGVDNGNEHTPTIEIAKNAFKVLWGSEDIAGFVENGKGGVQSYVKIAGQNFVLMDNRSFREPYTVNTRYAHYGQEQEDWLINIMKNNSGPFHLVDGGMWSSPTIIRKNPDGSEKRITEGLFGDHPLNFEGLMKEIFDTSKTFLTYSGDIHFSQIIDHGPQWKDTSRFAPFKYVEITSSPAHSIIFPGKTGEPPFWPDAQRLKGAKEYNFVVVESKLVGDSNLKISATALGVQNKPLFTYSAKIERTPGKRKAATSCGPRIKNI